MRSTCSDSVSVVIWLLSSVFCFLWSLNFILRSSWVFRWVLIVWICSGVRPCLPICIWGSRWWAFALSCCFSLFVSVMVCGLCWVAYIGVYWWELWGKFFSVGKGGRMCDFLFGFIIG